MDRELGGDRLRSCLAVLDWAGLPKTEDLRLGARVEAAQAQQAVASGCSQTNRASVVPCSSRSEALSPWETFAIFMPEGGFEREDPRHMAECPYCFQPISPEAARCHHCAGELFFCRSCRKMVAVDVKQEWVGILRGFRAETKRCRICHRVLVGPRW